jgi:hypothetical protein
MEAVGLDFMRLASSDTSILAVRYLSRSVIFPSVIDFWRRADITRQIE